MDNRDDNIFQISVKGLFFNSENKLLLIQEKKGKWEIPGGRILKGEQFVECLKRECQEEIGLEPEILDGQPHIIYPTIDLEGRARVMVFFRVKFNSLDFKPSDEGKAIEFFSKEEMAKLDIYPQLKPLLEHL